MEGWVDIRSGIDLWSKEKYLPLTEIEEAFFDRLGVVYKLRDSKVQSQFSPIPCQGQHSNNTSLLLSSPSRARRPSRDITADGGRLCDKATVFGAATKERFHIKM
jgi:hypothetical protein